MTIYFRCLSAEILKTRRTLYLVAVFVMPTILALFNFLLHLGIGHEPGYYGSPDGWVSFEHNTYTFWAILVLPFLLVLVCAFIAHLEHDTQQWRRLMCLAIPREPIYLAKTTIVFGLAILSSLILWAENILLGWLLSILAPELGLSLAHFSSGRTLLPFLLICLFASLTGAIQLWFSMRVRNFVLSVGLGLALILAGFFLKEISVVGFIFPWSLPALVYSARTLPEFIGGLAYSLVGWAAVTTAGCLDFTRRDVLS